MLTTVYPGVRMDGCAYVRVSQLESVLRPGSEPSGSRSSASSRVAADEVFGQIAGYFLEHFQVCAFPLKSDHAWHERPGIILGTH